MCGRFALVAKTDLLREFLGIAESDDAPPRYNIAPTQPILAVAAGPRRGEGSNLPERRALLLRWGFLPGWVKDPRSFPLVINARAETAAAKPSFRAAMRHRRILVPASGFFEWRRPAGKGAKAQAYWVHPAESEIVAFAGLMETWASPDGSEVDTGAILTTAANGDIGHIHERMPLVIHRQDFSRWLDCTTQEPRDVAGLMRPVEDGFFRAVPVSERVNKVANAGPELMEPVAEEQPQAAAPGEGPGQLSLF